MYVIVTLNQIYVRPELPAACEEMNPSYRNAAEWRAMCAVIYSEAPTLVIYVTMFGNARHTFGLIARKQPFRK